MTKVNYFLVKGKNPQGKDTERACYARSKMEASHIAGKNGMKEIQEADIRELNFKTEVIKMFSLQEQFNLRTNDKKNWIVKTPSK